MNKVLPMYSCKSRLAVVLFLCLASLSCSEGRFKKVYPVKGEVFYRGKPADGAMVSFHWLDNPEDPLARPMGKVDAEGRFILSTYKKDDGAPAGSYEVTIVWLPEGYKGPAEEGNKLPARYATRQTSGLKVQVVKDDNILEPFQLQK